MLPSQRYGRFPSTFCRLLCVAGCVTSFSTTRIETSHHCPSHSRCGDVTDSTSYDYTALPPISDSTSSGDLLLGMDFPSDEDLSRLPVGDQGGFCVVRNYTVPSDGFVAVGIIININSQTTNNSVVADGPECADIQRLQLTPRNVTLPVALVLLDSHTYPTLTRAKKACRRGAILIRRHDKMDHIGISSRPTKVFQFSDCRRGKVGDRVFPGDVIGFQMLLGNFKKKRTYPNIEYNRPSFQLPIVYEDDHMAVVNKPAGISVYGKRQSRSGSLSRRTVRDALPYALTPPLPGTPGGVLKRPVAVHRLDGHTSGLLLVAKTKVALDSLHRQLEEKGIQKIYTAVVNGKLSPDDNNSLETVAGLDPVWNFIDYPVGGKSALTSWRILREAPSLNAKDGILSMVELRPHTGRYHQLRRHMAWICRRPLVGDPLYAGALQAHHFRSRGLFLCSNAVAFRHPVYTISEGDKLNGEAFRICQDGITIEVTVSLELPKKFDKLLDGEEQWANQHLKN